MSPRPRNLLLNPSPLDSSTPPAPNSPGAGHTSCPPFVPGALRRQLALDAAIRWLAIAAVIFFVLAGSLWGAGETGGASGTTWGTGGTAAAVAIMVLWLWMGVTTTRVAQRLTQITGQLDYDMPAAEEGLAQVLRRWPLQRWLRLLLYHRLAVVRHRQRRYAETAAICQSVLGYPLGRAVAVRTHLLLMLVESRLQTGDVAGAYAGLVELHRVPLNLAELLQRLMMQTRYEVAAGYDGWALSRLDQKIALSELMPPQQCGTLHVLLAGAAERSAQPKVAAWLRQRAELLCTPEQLHSIT